MAEKIQMRIDQISAADSVETMLRFGIGRCHPLHGNREGEYAVDLVHPYRLVFIIDSKTNSIQIAEIQEIIDYH